MEASDFIAPAITVVGAVIVFYATVNARLAKIETLISVLSTNVEKHNNVIERTHKLESDLRTAFNRYDELSRDVQEIKKQHEHDMERLERK